MPAVFDLPLWFFFWLSTCRPTQAFDGISLPLAPTADYGPSVWLVPFALLCAAALCALWACIGWARRRPHGTTQRALAAVALLLLLILGQFWYFILNTQVSFSGNTMPAQYYLFAGRSGFTIALCLLVICLSSLSLRFWPIRALQGALVGSCVLLLSVLVLSWAALGYALFLCG